MKVMFVASQAVHAEMGAYQRPTSVHATEAEAKAAVESFYYGGSVTKVVAP